MTNTPHLTAVVDRLAAKDRIALLHEMAETVLQTEAPDLQDLLESLGAGKITEADATQHIYAGIAETYLLRAADPLDGVGELPSDGEIAGLFERLQSSSAEGQLGVYGRTLQSLAGVFGPIDWTRVERLANDGVKSVMHQLRANREASAPAAE